MKGAHGGDHRSGAAATMEPRRKATACGGSMLSRELGVVVGFAADGWRYAQIAATAGVASVRTSQYFSPCTACAHGPLPRSQASARFPDQRQV